MALCQRVLGRGSRTNLKRLGQVFLHSASYEAQRIFGWNREPIGDLDLTTIVEPQNGEFDSRLLRNGLGRFATGITVITTCGADGKLEGLTANSFSAVSLDPPLVLWSLDRITPSFERFQNSGYFAVNVLAAHQRETANHFAKTLLDKFVDIDWFAGLYNCPLLSEQLASFECQTVNVIDGGDHAIFLGRVDRFRYDVGDPLIFSAGQYCLAARLPEDTKGPDAKADLSNLL